jgi:hypothetical protein
MVLLQEELTGSIINCAYKVHSALGPGLLESAYEECLYYELEKNGLQVMTYLKLSGCRIGLLINFNVFVKIGNKKNYHLDNEVSL